MKGRAIVVGLVFLLVLFSGCLQDPILIRLNGGGGSDSNKVKVSVADTNADFLFSKLAGDVGVTLSILNPGAAEKVLISVAGGGGGRSYTSGTPATIQVSNDTNQISLNFDGNFSSRINALDLNNSLSYSKVNCDGNASCVITGKITTGLTIDANNIKFNGTLSGGDFNQSILDHNNSFSCNAGEAIQTIGNTTACIAIGGSGTGRTYTSGTPATIQVNNDTNTISQNFDGNFNSRAANLFPVADGNILSDVRYRQDASCDNNVLCRLLSSTILWDSNAVLDGRYALIGSIGSGRTYTSGTPATIQVNNDTNTISQNFDGNFQVRFDSNFNTRFPISFDLNFYTKFLPVFDSNFYTKFKPMFDSNLAGAVPWQDENIASNTRYRQDASCDNNTNCTLTGKITTTLDANFNNIKFIGVLSGGDFNYSLSDANGSQTATAGQALSSVGAAVTSIPIPPSLGSCDNNTSCVITGRINTNFDSNFGGDANFTDPVTITDGNAFAFLVETAAGADRFRIDTVSDLIYTSTIRPLSAGGQDVGQSAVPYRDAWLTRDLNAFRAILTDLNFFGTGGGNRLNLVDLNATRGTIKDLNVTTDANVGDDLLVNDDINGKSDLGIDGNIALNTLGGRVGFKTNTIPFCIYGNNFDANGGLVFAPC